MEPFTHDELIALTSRRLFELHRLMYDVEEISQEMLWFANCIETDTEEMP